MKRSMTLMNKILAIALCFVATSLSAQNGNIPVCIDTQEPDTAKVDTTGFYGNTGDIAVVNSQMDVQKKLTYIRSVSDKAVYMQNISSGISLMLKGMGHIFNVDGKLQMRRNEVIRICIYAPILGFEVARLEFTPTYVLLLDRYHKQYVKEAYDGIDFLKAEGLSFYTLQSLFWNELFQPGKERLSESDFTEYTVDLNVPCIRFKTKDTLYRWNTDKNDQITYAGMTYDYANKTNYSTVMVNYGNFTTIGVKQFPKKLYITFNSRTVSTGALSLNMDMNNISTDSDWDSLTKVSDSYPKVTVDEFFSKLGNF